MQLTLHMLVILMHSPIYCKTFFTFYTKFISTKDRLIEKQEELRKAFVSFFRNNEDHSRNTIVNYQGDFITNDVEQLTGHTPTDFAKFINSNTYMFANLLDIAEHSVPMTSNTLMQTIGSSFRRRKPKSQETVANPVFAELNTCMSVEGQEKIIFKFLTEKYAEPNNQLSHVVNRFATLFTSNYTINEKRISVQEELENFKIGKNVINAFMERMMDILSLQVHQQIINSPHAKKEIVQAHVRDMTGYFYQIIENLLFTQIQPTVLALYKRHHALKTKSLNHKCAVELKRVTPMHLEINPQFCLSEKGPHNTGAKNAEHHYSRAIEHLRKLPQQTHTLGKLQILVETGQMIQECVKDYYEGQDAPVGADDLVPIFIYLIIRANVPDLYCEYKMIEDFTHESVTMGNIGYSLATLQASTEHVSSLNWRTLDQNYIQMEERKKSQAQFNQKKNKDRMIRKMKGMSMSINATISPFLDSPTASPVNTLPLNFSAPLTVEEAVRLSKRLLTEILAVYLSEPKFSENRYGWGTLNELTSLIQSIPSYRMRGFIELTQDLKRVDLALFLAQDMSPSFLTIFLINLYHVMVYHGILAHGSFPMLQERDREDFYATTQYDIGTLNFTLNDVYCLLTGKGNCRIHEQEQFHRNDPSLHFVLNQCCFSSPPLHVLGMKSDSDLKQMLDHHVAAYLSDTCHLDHDKKQLLVPQQLGTFGHQFGHSTDDLLHWLIEHLPHDSILRKEILTVDISDTEGSYNIKTQPFCYDFWFRSPIVSVNV
jgi:hypothetical protein